MQMAHTSLHKVEENHQGQLLTINTLCSSLCSLEADRDLLKKKMDQHREKADSLWSELLDAQESNWVKHTEHQEYVKKTSDRMTGMHADKGKLEAQVRELMATIKCLRVTQSFVKVGEFAK